jgi:hypothetical protein
MDLIELSVTSVNVEKSELVAGTTRTVKVDLMRLFLWGGHWFGLIPPLVVLNEFFQSGSTGGTDEGASVIYEWPPFTIAERDYQDFVSALRVLPGTPFIEDTTIPVEDWSHHAFVKAAERIAGVDA